MNNNVIARSAALTEHVRVGLTHARERRCRQCGTEVSRSIKRCPICGQPLSVRPPHDAV